MNPIRWIAKFNNELAWWLGRRWESKGKNREWAYSSGSRIASLLATLNLINLWFLFEIFSKTKLKHSITITLFVTIFTILLVCTESKKDYDFANILSYSTKQIDDIKYDSISYIIATLAILTTTILVLK